MNDLDVSSLNESGIRLDINGKPMVYRFSSRHKLFGKKCSLMRIISRYRWEVKLFSGQIIEVNRSKLKRI